jgi:hypothetical protein
MKTIMLNAVGLAMCLASFGQAAEVKRLEVARVPSEMQETVVKRAALPTLRYTYPVHREEWRDEGLERAFDRPRRNLDIGRGDRRSFFEDYVDR